MKLNPDTRGLWYIYKATATMLLGCRSLLLLHLRRQFLCWRRVLSPCILGPCHIYQAIGAMHLGFRTFLLHLPCHQFLFVYQVLSSDILGPYNIYHIYLCLLIIFTFLLMLMERYCMKWAWADRLQHQLEDCCDKYIPPSRIGKTP